ncbi:hypothetical protein FHL15_004187 [Xylaria flabelliformis]|uniref:SprT-like domain-containing protein n=1 Tax=Xylaria flabelliformis TaxID=2512241 RepID=A0A553I4H7_9PEZI|nr:hypothetical protein FHL15_004187 [Xylaria flabelliformis]
MADSLIVKLKNAIDAYALQAPDKVEEKQDSPWKHAKKATKDSKEAAKKVAMQVAKRMTKPVLNLIFVQPTVLHPRQHPEWPGYTGTGTKLDFRLQTQVYESRCLVENTIACFYPTTDHLNLTPTQLEARSKIISLFEKLKDSKEPIGRGELSEFMRLFDDFFFFGAMTNKCPRRVFLCVWLKEDLFAKHYVNAFFEPIMPWGFTRDRYVRGYGPTSEIHIAGSTFYIDPAPLWFLVQTLIHEMVHAYVHVFLCQCPTCRRDSNNTCGPTGHGQTFLMLIDCIDQTLRSWGVGLSGLVNEKVSYLCAAGAACPQATEHDWKGCRWFRCDELMNLYEKEKRLIEMRSLSRNNEPSSQLEEKRELESVNEAKDNEQEKKGQDLADMNEAEDEKQAKHEQDQEQDLPDVVETEDKKQEDVIEVKDKQQEKQEQDPTDVIEGNDTKKEKLEQDRTEVNKLRLIEEREPGTQVYMTAAQAGATKVEQAMLDRTCDIVQELIAKMPAKPSEKSSTNLNLPEAQRQMDDGNVWMVVDSPPRDCQFFTSQPRLPWPTSGNLPWPRTEDEVNPAPSPAATVTTAQQKED